MGVNPKIARMGRAELRPMFSLRAISVFAGTSVMQFPDRGGLDSHCQAGLTFYHSARMG